MGPSHNEIQEGLRRAASRRVRTQTLARSATDDLRVWAQRADAAGVARTEIAELAGLSREGLYHVMGWRGLDKGVNKPS